MTKMATATLDELLLSTEFLADPYPILQRMREEDPVHWSDSIGAWMVTRYHDIVPPGRSGDVSRFSNEGRLAKTVEYLPPHSRARFKNFEDHYRAKSLIHSDPPDHTRLRSLVTAVFNAGRVEADDAPYRGDC